MTDGAPQGQVPCHQCHLRDCPGLRDHSAEDLTRIQAFKSGEIDLDRGSQALIQGAQSAHVYTVLEGVLIRYRLMDNGQRQIINFHFPGDLVGLQATLHEPMQHSVEALTPARLCVFPRDGVIDFISDNASLAYDVVWLAAKEESALENHIVSLGTRNARERIAYLAVFLLHRGSETCVADGHRMQLPVTQRQIADMLGLSLVHTNRSIQTLRREGLVEWSLDQIHIPDLKAAREYTQFDASAMKRRPFI